MPKPVRFIFTSRNYFLILASGCLLVLGFVLMSGKGNSGNSQFNEDIYSFRRITLAPLIILAGYASVIYAIFSEGRKPKKQKE
jgi:hypothetical protein